LFDLSHHRDFKFIVVIIKEVFLRVWVIVKREYCIYVKARIMIREWLFSYTFVLLLVILGKIDKI
jgi:hypothetical protein